MAQVSADVLDQAGMSLEDIKLVVPHQANKRILDALAKESELARIRYLSTCINMAIHLRGPFQLL